MKAEGFVFSLEAFFSLFCVFLLYSMLSIQQPALGSNNLEELYLLQKANDLLKVWSMAHSLSGEELLSDVKLVFPSNCVVLQKNGLALNSCKQTSSFFSAKAGIFSQELLIEEIELFVYY